MTKDEIMQALLMMARGFPNHPDVRNFAEKLEQLFAGMAPAKTERITGAELGAAWGTPLRAEEIVKAEVSAEPKRGPGRPKKAE
jgi:hypothetical protein